MTDKNAKGISDYEDGSRAILGYGMKPWQGCHCSAGEWLAKEQRLFRFKLVVKRALKLLWPLALVAVGIFIGKIL